MSVFYVTLVIWAVPWVVPNTPRLTETNVNSIFGNELLLLVELDFDSEEEECNYNVESSDSEDLPFSEESSNNGESSDSEGFSIINPLGSEFYAEEMANAMNAATSNPENEQIDDSGDLPEENPTQDNKTENSYIWAHAGILEWGNRGHIFFSQSGEIPTCLIVATHENATVQLRAKCIGRFEKWIDVKEISMHTITEEAEDVWTEPSAEIIELIEQFKNETMLYEENIRPFQSEHILKLAAVYSKMHPESKYPHVHTYCILYNFCFEVHV